MSIEVLERIEADIQQLSLDEQLRLIEHLIQQIRTQSRTPESQRAAQVAAMATDPEIQRELRQIAAEFAGTELDGLQED